MKDLNNLIRGFNRFHHRFFESDNYLYDKLRHGQSPKTLIIGCSDSRVDPAILTDCKPGDIFVVRVVGNLVPPYEPDTKFHGVSSSIEYAVRFLKVEHIIILGHSSCSGINLLMTENDEQETESEFINSWVDIALPAKNIVQKEMIGKPFEIQCKVCEQAAMILSLENLMTFPWIAERVENNKLSLHAWYFELETGNIHNYDTETCEFEILASK
ncbi:carbonic anhydrase [Methanolapillus millepedarum]|uniref:carbonic anhydrase n=1 Tax=Methanolapillus millepedarum TaxID=3028296 RepID=A0AA96V3N6_9EURY|nr:Carbonic anhydrase 1 [Methanosarcinaceae archaeon Ac7]